MQGLLLKLYVKVQCLLAQDDGQNMIEYALVAALVALGATAAMTSFAGQISTAFSNVGSSLIKNVT